MNQEPDKENGELPEADAVATEMPERSIGKRIAAGRERLGLTQTKLAERTKHQDPEGRGIPRTVLIGYEAGKHLPGARELRVLCDALKVDIEWLLYGYEDTTAEDADRAASTEMVRYPFLGSQLKLVFWLSRLKSHEQEAIATLIYGLGSKTFKTEQEAKSIETLANSLVTALVTFLERATGRDTAVGDLMASFVLGRPIDDFNKAMEELNAELGRLPPLKVVK